MRPPLDPRVGNRRQKGLLKKIAQQAMARKGVASRVGRFSKTGVGAMPAGARGGFGRGAKPFGSFGSSTAGALFSNPAGHSMPSQARPQAFMLPAPVAAQPAAPEDFSAAPSVAPPDAPPQYTTGDIIPPAEVGSNPFVTGDPTGAGLGGVATGDPEHNAFLSGLTDIDPFGGFSQQAAPSSPISTVGGLIPLGGGIFYDPETGALQGRGGSYRTGQQEL